MRVTTLVFVGAASIAGCGGNAPSSALPPMERTIPLSSGFAVLHRFTGLDGGSPTGPLVADSNGNLYGVALYGGANNLGTVFELIPPQTKGAKWTESVLYAFATGSGGSYPQPGLVRDEAGNLFGVTFGGGNCPSACGVVFELSPPRRAHGRWRYAVLFAFTGPKIGDGGGPVGYLVMDASGNLYGSTYYGGGSVCTHEAGPCGVIFELSPPTSTSGAWHETVLHSFTGVPDGDTPGTGVTLDAHGNVLGTTEFGGTGRCNDGEGTVIGCGVFFELTSTGSTWSETILYEFKPKHSPAQDALLLRPNGTLLGPVSYDIAELKQARGKTWSLKPLYQFTEGVAGTLPGSALIADGKGHYFGTTQASGLYGYGTVYRFGRAPTGWGATTLHTFSGGLDSMQPRGGVVFGFQGALYGATSSLAKLNRGYVFRIGP